MSIAFDTVLSNSVIINLPFTKLFGTHTFYQGGRGGGGGFEPKSPAISRTDSERENLQGIRDTFENLTNVKVVHIVFTWLR